MTVAREDIVRYVGTAFIGGGADRLDLVTLARAARAPEGVLQVLRSLPNQRFDRLYDVWGLLPDVSTTAAADERDAPAEDVVAGLSQVTTGPGQRRRRAA